LRELASGIGFVDVSVVFSAQATHLIELKVLNGALVGASQLESYMRNEGRTRGWLVVVDPRGTDKRATIPESIKSAHGIITTVVIDINPTPPSKR